MAGLSDQARETDDGCSVHCETRTSDAGDSIQHGQLPTPGNSEAMADQNKPHVFRWTSPSSELDETDFSYAFVTPGELHLRSGLIASLKSGCYGGSRDC